MHNDVSYMSWLDVTMKLHAGLIGSEIYWMIIWNYLLAFSSVQSHSKWLNYFLFLLCSISTNIVGEGIQNKYFFLQLRPKRRKSIWVNLNKKGHYKKLFAKTTFILCFKGKNIEHSTLLIILAYFTYLPTSHTCLLHKYIYGTLISLITVINYSIYTQRLYLRTMYNDLKVPV